MNEIDEKRTRAEQRRRAGAKELRVALHRVAWLNGAPEWHDDRIAWRTDQGLFVPSPSHLARTHFRLRQIERNLEKTRLLLGAPELWLAEQWRRFRTAERLAPMRAPNLSLIAVRCGEGNVNAENQCIALLEAEAACVNALPISPARALAIPAHGRAERLARSLGGLTPEARALAALSQRVLMHRQGWTAEAHSAVPIPLRQLPERPDVIAAMLAAGADSALLERWMALPHGDRFSLDPTTARLLLHSGVTSEDMTAIAENLARFGRSVTEALAYRHRLTVPSSLRSSRKVQDAYKPRRQQAEKARQWREEALSALAGLARRYVEDGCPETMRQLADFASATADLVRPFGHWREVLGTPLSTGLTLDRDVRLRYVTLLNETQHTFWNRAKAERHFDAPTERPLRQWLVHQIDRFNSLAKLAKLENIELAKELWDAGCSGAILNYGWRGESRYRLALWLIRQCDVYVGQWLWTQAAHIVDRCGGGETRESLVFLMQAAMDAVPAERPDAAYDFLREIVNFPHDAFQAVLRNHGLIADIRRRARTAGRPETLQECVRIAVALANRYGTKREPPYADAIAYLQSRPPRDSATQDDPCPLPVDLIALLAFHGGDISAILKAAEQHADRLAARHLDRVTTQLARMPALCRAIAYLLSCSPGPCLALIEQIEMLIHLGYDCLDALTDPMGRILDGTGRPSLIPLTPDTSWHRLFRAVPDLATEAAMLQQALWIGRASPEMPVSLRKIVDAPERRRRELRFLESLVEGERVTEDQIGRAKKLRETPGTIDVRAIRDRLPRLAAEAVLAAAAALIQRVKRRRLESLTGPVDDATARDETVLQAALLSGNIHYNRKILIEMLRAAVSGDLDWVGQRPENREFLARLNERGTDPAVWLAPHARTVPCPGVAGKRVRIFLETDPLRILPMGSYFGTCLSIHSFNAYSVVANAVDLNKRVIYARDADGRVVGRKLIGLTPDFLLLGFHTFANTADPEEHDTLCGIIDRFARDFAAACGLTTADTGSIETLLAEQWYDDGATGWTKDGASAGHPAPRKRRADSSGSMRAPRRL